MTTAILEMETIEVNITEETLQIQIEGGIGASGLSAYQIAVKNGFTGTEAEWLESLKPIAINLSDYAKKADIPVVPNIANLATKTELQVVALSIPDISQKAEKSEIPNISNLATKSELQGLSLLIPDVSQIANKSELIPLATKQEVATGLNEKANVSHVHSDLATKQELNSAIQAIPVVDLSTLAVKTDMDTALSLKASTVALNEAILAVNTTLETKATEQELSTAVQTINTAIGLKANSSDLNSKAESLQVASSFSAVSEEMALKANKTEIPSIVNLATKAELQEAVGNVDLSPLATKLELTEGLSSKADASTTMQGLTGLSTALSQGLQGKANTIDIYTKNELNTTAWRYINTEIDFGATDTDLCRVAIPCDWIKSDSKLIVEILGEETSEHSTDEIITQYINIKVVNIVPNVSFDLIAYCEEKTYGKFKVKVAEYSVMLVATPNTYIETVNLTENHTITEADMDKMLVFNSATPVTLTIPTNATLNLRNGFTLAIKQKGLGSVIIAGEQGVILESRKGLTTAGQLAMCSVINEALDLWSITGDLK